MDNETSIKEPEETTGVGTDQESQNGQTGIIIGVSIAAVIIIGGLIAFAIFLLTGRSETTEKIRDVFIIFMALESMIIGLVLVILVVQLAKLTNLLQNEVKPILDSTNETVSTLRGTAQFLSDNLTEPVIKLNEYFAGLQSITRIVLPERKKKKSKRRNENGKQQ
jgi:uncharacterized oligopeptide transporter (OPT) family protein